MSYKTSLFFTTLFITLFLLLGCSNKRELKTIVFSSAIKEDATPAVLSTIQKLKDNVVATKITFEKGVYHFYPDKAFETYCCPSNYGDVVAKTAFPLTSKKNITIDGQGSTFIFHGVIIPFLINNCHNISIKNLNIDWNQTFHSQALVIANDKTKGTFDVKISKQQPYEICNGKLYFIKEYYQHPLNQVVFFDPNRRAVAFNTQSDSSLPTNKTLSIQRNFNQIDYKYQAEFHAQEQECDTQQAKLKVEELSAGMVRIYNHNKKLPEVGMVMVSKNFQADDKTVPAIQLSNTSTFFATNVNIFHAGGTGVKAENTKDVFLDNLNILPSIDRMVSTTSGATHFVSCRGKINIKDCVFKNQLGNALNIHGVCQQVVDIVDDYTIGVKVGNYQQHGFEIGVSGDSIGVIQLKDNNVPYAKLTLKNISKVNHQYHLVSFDQKLPKTIKVGDLIENLSAYPELLVQNCNISNNKSCGLVIFTPQKVEIKDNFFSTEKEAVLVSRKNGKRYNSGQIQNLHINNNTFRDCNHGGDNRGVIRFITDNANSHIAFKNIEITYNRLEHFDNLILEINNTSGLKFENNIITYSGNFKPLFPNQPAFIINKSQHIQFNNNNYQGKASALLMQDNKIADGTFK